MKTNKIVKRKEALLKALKILKGSNKVLITNCSQINELIPLHLQYSRSYLPKIINKLESEGVLEAKAAYLQGYIGSQLILTFN